MRVSLLPNRRRRRKAENSTLKQSQTVIFIIVKLIYFFVTGWRVDPIYESDRSPVKPGDENLMQ